MRVTIQHGLKIPGPEQYSSRQHSIAVDLDVPPEIASDKDRLQVYVANVGASVRRQVEEALGQSPLDEQERLDQSEANGNGDDTGRERRPHQAPRFSNGNHRRGGVRRNGRPHGSRRNEVTPASDRQTAFLENLRKRARYTPAQFDALCLESYGCRAEDLSKRDASSCIEMLTEEIG